VTETEKSHTHLMRRNIVFLRVLICVAVLTLM
jgi:hypothetical protein